jgi:hypothetical protein
MDIDLSTEGARVAAECRVLALWATLEARRDLSPDDWRWLCQTAHAAILACGRPLPAPLFDELPEPPPWLKRMQEDFNVQP